MLTVVAVTVMAVLGIVSQYITGVKTQPSSLLLDPVAGGWLGSYSPSTQWEGKKNFIAVSWKAAGQNNEGDDP